MTEKLKFYDSKYNRPFMDFIEQDNPRAALAFVEKARLAITNPTMYRTGCLHGTREIVVNNNDVMVYKVDEKAQVLTVLRVLHVAQQFPKKTKVL